jgi:hypothetical protein
VTLSLSLLCAELMRPVSLGGGGSVRRAVAEATADSDGDILWSSERNSFLLLCSSSLSPFAYTFFHESPLSRPKKTSRRRKGKGKNFFEP